MTDFLLTQIKKRKKIIRFIIAGGTAAIVNFSLLYFFTDILGFWYLLSSVLSFAISLFANFCLQKFWTFGDNDKGKNILYKQLTIYVLLALFNLMANTVLMYILVDIFGLWYMLAQFFIAALIATWNFLVYKFFVFNQNV